MGIPSGQKWLIKCVQVLGYNFNEGGLCFGISHVGMKAFLINDVDLFINRLEQINNIPPKEFKNEIENARCTMVDIFAKAKSKEIEQKKQELARELSKQEIQELYTSIKKQIALELTDQKELVKKLDIPIFFEEILLLQEISKYSHLFEEGKSPVNQEALPVFEILKSQALEEKGGVKEVGSFSGCYVLSDLKIYFKMLREMAEVAEFPISFILGSSNHSIHVGYDHNKKLWVFVDGRQLSSIYISDDDIIEKVIRAFSPNLSKTDNLAIFNTKINVTEHNYIKTAELFDKYKNTKDWKKIHEVTSENEKIKLQDSSGSSLLYIAAKTNDIDLVKTLLENGVDINIACTNDMTALRIAAAKGYIALVEILLKGGANIGARLKAVSDPGVTPLHDAVTQGQSAVVKILLENGSDINAAIFSSGCTALHLAIIDCRLDMVKILLAKGANVNAKTITDDTPLHLATIKGDTNLVTTLLEKDDIEINAVNMNGYSPLYIAVAKGHAKIVEALLMNGADINAALHIAITKSHTKIVEDLVNYGADINATNIYGFIPLHCAVRKGNAEVIKILLNKNANTDAVNSDGDTPLLIAAANSDFNPIDANSVTALLEKGADIDISLYIATTKKKFVVFKNLMSYGANINAALYIAAEKVDANSIELLLEHGADINAALHIAVQRSDTKAIKVLLNNGANINAANIDGDTPLVIAARNSDDNIVKVILDQGVDINAALHDAIRRGNIGVVKVLLNKGANINSTNIEGQNPFDIAKQNGHSNIVKLLYIQMLTNHCIRRDKEKEYKTSIQFFKVEFNFGISKKEEITAAQTLREVLEGSKSANSLKDYERILNYGDLKLIYDKIKQDIEFDKISSIQNTK